MWHRPPPPQQQQLLPPPLLLHHLPCASVALCEVVVLGRHQGCSVAVGGLSLVSAMTLLHCMRCRC
jgi:hypothetical protein